MPYFQGARIWRGSESLKNWGLDTDRLMIKTFTRLAQSSAQIKKWNDFSNFLTFGIQVRVIYRLSNCWVGISLGNSFKTEGKVKLQLDFQEMR